MSGRNNNGSGSKSGGSREYIVHSGRQPGTYDKWSDAKAQVDRYPNNCYERAKPADDNRYVVYEGKNPGVYDQWRDAHQQVAGYPDNSYERVKGADEAKSRFNDYNSQK